MTRDKFSKRLFRIKATAPEVIPEPVNNNRRGKNYVEMNTEESNYYEDFFEFEKDLVELESSRVLASNAFNSKDFFDESDNSLDSERKKPEVIKESKQQYIIMDDLDLKETPIIVGVFLEELDAEDPVPENYSEIDTTFEFIQCSAIKSDGERCKRQAPKDHTTCSILAHRSQESSTNKEKVNE